MKKHLNIRITGRVQGVWFRHHTRLKAEELGITGLVRNEDDGSVYAEAEGEEGALEQFLGWCRTGPERAHVDSVETTEGEVRGYDDFVVQKKGIFGS